MCQTEMTNVSCLCVHFDVTHLFVLVLLFADYVVAAAVVDSLLIFFYAGKSDQI